MALPILNEEHHDGHRGGQSAHQMPGTAPHAQEQREIQANLAGVKRRIGVHSGKGGVGKTFLAVNLALALAAGGKKAGLLDADIDCPNAARFLNLRAVPLEGTPEGRIRPLEHRGLRIVSTHFLTDEPDAPMIVRGPIKHKVLAELLGHVDWGELDVLVYDLPPGTADVPLSSMLIGCLDGIIIVTTPQKESLMDARKSALMAKEMGVPVLGVVENMSGEVFGTGAGKALASELGVPLLAVIPLDGRIRRLCEDAKAALVEIADLQGAAGSLMRAATGETIALQRSFWKTLMNR